MSRALRPEIAKPPEATFEEAHAHLREAERLSPGFWKRNHLLIARAALGLGRKEEARTWLLSAIAMPTRTAEDVDTEKEAKALLSRA